MWIDPNVKRKNALLAKHLVAEDFRQAKAPLFSMFELNLTGLCNRTCEFCPRADPAVFPNTAEYMTGELYAKMFQELAELSYSGLVIYSGFSEPLYHKQLPEFLAIGRASCPKARLEVYTNGDFLNPEKMRRLYEAGMTSLHISMYDGQHQVERFATMREESGLPVEAVVLRERWFKREEGYGLTLSNRSGMVKIEALRTAPLREPLKQNCLYPFYMFFVDHNGDVLLCSHDWGKRLVVGNLNHAHIMDVWNSRAMRTAREKLGNRDRSHAPCDTCDVKGTLIGKGHYDEWKRYYHQHDRLVAPDRSSCD